jgi:kynureninase
MRVAPAPLYNSAKDVHEFVSILRDVVAEVRKAMAAGEGGATA